MKKRYKDVILILASAGILLAGLVFGIGVWADCSETIECAKDQYYQLEVLSVEPCPVPEDWEDSYIPKKSYRIRLRLDNLSNRKMYEPSGRVGEFYDPGENFYCLEEWEKLPEPLSKDAYLQRYTSCDVPPHTSREMSVVVTVDEEAQKIFLGYEPNLYYWRRDPQKYSRKIEIDLP